MATATAEAPKKAPEQPPDPEFWIRHSPRFEFSISTLASITVHVVLFGMFFLIVARLMQIKTAKPEVPFRSVSIADESSDDSGKGSHGAGGGSPKETVDEAVLPSAAVPEVTQVELDKIKIKVSDWVPDLKSDDQALEAVANSPARDKLANMDPGLRNELLKGLGDKKGKGTGPGRGTGDKPGAGSGNDTEQSISRKRALGWTIQFEAREGGREYLDKLASLKATLIFQRPNSKELEDAIVFQDLSRGAKPKPYTPGVVSGLFFIDDERRSIRQAVSELNIDFEPRCMIAVFPKDVEEDMARKSTAFRNKREEDISQTVFRVFFANGTYDIRVVSQVMKRGRN